MAASKKKEEVVMTTLMTTPAGEVKRRRPGDVWPVDVGSAVQETQHRLRATTSRENILISEVKLCFRVTLPYNSEKPAFICPKRVNYKESRAASTREKRN